MSEAKAENETFPSPLPSRSVQIAAEYLTERVELDMGCKHGKTAFYWALIHTIMSHGGRKEKAEPTRYVFKDDGGNVIRVKKGAAEGSWWRSCWLARTGGGWSTPYSAGPMLVEQAKQRAMSADYADATYPDEPAEKVS